MTNSWSDGPPHVLIVGGGIGGLTAALALQRFGIGVTVFEQADELREIGAGVVITPNAMHALDWLDVGERIAAEAGPTPRYQIGDYRDGSILEVGPPVESFAERFGAGYHNVHRGDLQAALAGALRAHDPDALVLGHVFEDLEQDDRRVTARFANGAVHRGDALVGADGGTSRVRAVVFGDTDVNYTGQVAFRALIPAERLPDACRDSPYMLLVGPGRMLLRYPLRCDTVTNVIGIARQPDWQSEGWSIPATTSEFGDLFEGFNPAARALIAAVPEGALFKWGLRDREPLGNWTKGRVTMLGDAAHPTTPFLGQGACMAIEDGMILGRAFDVASDVPTAFALYEGARKERANGVQLASREQARHLQGQTAVGPSAGSTAAARGLFDYNPVTVPL